MPLGHLSDPDAVIAAMAEFDRLGRGAFLAKYGFNASKQYVVGTTGMTTTRRPSLVPLMASNSPTRDHWDLRTSRAGSATGRPFRS
jgi:hypothetical protein